MRIIGGTYKGKQLTAPKNLPVRPTTDFAKEGLFNIFQNKLDFEELKTLDLFGGTGSISYELASRGVPDLTIVEKDQKMFDFIKTNASALKIENLKIVRADVFKFIDTTQEQFNFIFAGPPYALQEIDQLPVLIFERKLLQPSGWFVLEHTPRNDYKELPFFNMQRNYGTTVFSFFINQFSTTE